MPYKLLKKVIAELRRKSTCLFCQSHFTDDSIFVLASSFNPETARGNALFSVFCPQCTAGTFIVFQMGATMKFETKPMSGSTISTNEILDMHNFLKDWKGDVQELFGTNAQLKNQNDE